MVSGVSSSSSMTLYFDQQGAEMSPEELTTQMEMNAASQAGSQMNQQAEETQQETEELMQDAWSDLPGQM